MTELIDRGELMNSLSNAWEKAELMAAINSAPAVKVVHCNECVHLKDGLFCDKHHLSDGTPEPIMSIIQDRMFCALGDAG